MQLSKQFQLAAAASRRRAMLRLGRRALRRCLKTGETTNRIVTLPGEPAMSYEVLAEYSCKQESPCHGYQVQRWNTGRLQVNIDYRATNGWHTASIYQ